MARPRQANGTAKQKPASNGQRRAAAAAKPANQGEDDIMDDVIDTKGDEEEDDDDEVAEFEMLDRLNDEGAFDSEEEDDEAEDAEEAQDGDSQEIGEDEDLSEEDEGEDVDGGAVLPADTQPQGPPLVSAEDAAAATAGAEPSLAALLHPHRPTPFVHDAGHLLVVDPNPLPTDSNFSEAGLAAATRDAAQSLLNTLLTTCAVRNSPAGVTMALPAPTTSLPREKRVPTPRPPTKWEAFARKKGIGKFAKGAASQQQREGRAGKLEFDEATGEWVPRYGYKGRNKAGEQDWLVEIDEDGKKAGKAKGKASSAAGGEAMDVDPRGAKRAERKERVRRQERAQRANERRGRQ